MSNHTPEEMLKRRKERQLACAAVDKHWKETEFHEDDTKNESEFAEHEKSWKGGYVHGWMEKYTRTSNLECQLAVVTAQRDELLAVAIYCCLINEITELKDYLPTIRAAIAKCEVQNG